MRVRAPLGARRRALVGVHVEPGFQHRHVSEYVISSGRTLIFSSSNGLGFEWVPQWDTQWVFPTSRHRGLVGFDPRPAAFRTVPLIPFHLIPIVLDALDYLRIEDDAVLALDESTGFQILNEL